MMFHRDNTRVDAACGKSAAYPVRIYFMSDEFPVTCFSLFHACILNATASRKLTEHSLRIFTEARNSEDWNTARDTVVLIVPEGESPIHVQLILAADKKEKDLRQQGWRTMSSVVCVHASRTAPASLGSRLPTPCNMLKHVATFESFLWALPDKRADPRACAPCA
eukprot:1411534-Pleurochrysis_carterae.AAC.1